MHIFKGWANCGLTGNMEIDFEALSLVSVDAVLDTCCLDTGDKEKNKAMRDFFNLDNHPESRFMMTQCLEFCRLKKDGGYRITVQGILDFAGIRRQLPITANISTDGKKINMDLQFKWSFRAYGLKPPRLLFMSVRDIVDIKAHLEFEQTNKEEEVCDS
jgi:polyisoprenoid-binding protein YceI